MLADDFSFGCFKLVFVLLILCLVFNITYLRLLVFAGLMIVGGFVDRLAVLFCILVCFGCLLVC